MECPERQAIDKEIKNNTESLNDLHNRSRHFDYEDEKSMEGILREAAQSLRFKLQRHISNCDICKPNQKPT